MSRYKGVELDEEVAPAEVAVFSAAVVVGVSDIWPFGSGAGVRAWDGALVGGMALGWLPGVAGGGGVCANERDGERRASAVIRVGMKVRIGTTLKFIKAREHVDRDRGGGMRAVIIHAVDFVDSLGSDRVGSARRSEAGPPGGGGSVLCDRTGS